MIDLYALPNDFPGKTAHHRNPDDPTPYAKALEEAFGQRHRGCSHSFLTCSSTNTRPCSSLDPEAFRDAFDNCDHAIEQLKSIADNVSSIEHIDDGPTTAPSKRIIKVIPEYEGRKASAGPEIAERIGLAVIREKCPHFHEWLTRLEGLWK